jgi:hypothetical protein
MDAGQQSQSVKLDVTQGHNRSCRKIALPLTMPELARHWRVVSNTETILKIANQAGQLVNAVHVHMDFKLSRKRVTT